MIFYRDLIIVVALTGVVAPTGSASFANSRHRLGEPSEEIESLNDNSHRPLGEPSGESESSNDHSLRRLEETLCDQEADKALDLCKKFLNKDCDLEPLGPKCARITLAYERGTGTIPPWAKGPSLCFKQTGKARKICKRYLTNGCDLPELSEDPKCVRITLE
jgi:hypothetical protein